ncbi:uncharacterized protein LOC129222914 [Uloborus diversus]|uniref:uncharacterized protein LOC129222914 n=1 Tax=Uloborus diversus TaxID=327109 RepID=UPI00240A127C|nr:uncharacterized protein LOC129222914 [Uloborus diversus]
MTKAATVPPLSVIRQPPFFEDPTILVPIVCAIVVLVVIISVTAFVVVWKRRDPAGEAPSDIYSRGSGGRADDISMSSYGKAKGNSVYDSQREPLYYPLPYATTHIPNHALQDPTSASPEQSLQRTRVGGRLSEHTYDVPQRVQHRHNVPHHQYSQLWANNRGFCEKPSLMSSRGDIDDFDVAIAMAEKYAAFRLSQTRANQAVLMESSGWSFVVTQLAPKQVIPSWLFVNDPEDLPAFQEEMCPNIEEYDEESLDQEEMSETECDRDCIGVERQRKYVSGSYSRVGAVIVC